MNWPDMTINGRHYSLSHLQPFTIGVALNGENAPTYKLYVSFGSHTFSKKWEKSDPIDHRMNHNQEERCFCTIRHDHSLHLPAIIQQGVSGKAYFSQTHNYLLVHNLPGMNAPYAVFFNIEKSKSKTFDAAMFVVSAYEKPGLPKNLPKITFNTLIAKISRGEKIFRPKK